MMFGQDQAPLGLPIFVLRRVLIQNRVVQRLVAQRLVMQRLTIVLRAMMKVLVLTGPHAPVGGI